MDQKLRILINLDWTSPALDRVMALLSCFAAWVPLLAILVVCIVWRGGFRARSYVVTAVLIIAFNDSVLSNSIKHLVHRPRPAQVLDGVRQVDLKKATPLILAVCKAPSVKYSSPVENPGSTGRSLPSSHTINTISLALVTACFYRKFGWISAIPALLVAYSRIYTGSHWPSDVLIALFLGVGATLILLAALNWFWREKGARFLPAIHQRHPALFAS